MGLAYELVINSNPCISYNMEENSMAMQALVMAHAAFGHNHFFKNNYLFRQWTDAEAILDYMEFSKHYIAKCEERHGAAAVEATLDAAHAVMDHGVFRYQRNQKWTLGRQEERERARREHEERTFNDLWRTLPQPRNQEEADQVERDFAERKKRLNLPEENLLYFIEKNSPMLETWQREILRIVRNIAQYFYPQKQTKVMNEGCATFVHHYILNALYDKGLIGEGAMLEVLHHHSNVVMQPNFDDRRYQGINPYALGFNMMQDIRRICEDPSEEDRRWFADFAGSGDWRTVLKDAWADYRDESFIRQFLSPRLIRRMKLFVLSDEEKDRHYTVDAIHDERGYEAVRRALALNYDVGLADPNIQIVDVDLRGDRELRLEHRVREGVTLAAGARDEVLKHVRFLWGYDVTLAAVDAETGDTLEENTTAQRDEAA
jgi:spore cortex formation protein SpoVR/YcgB (stage V sporulation)